jgi:hypothetical protein
MYWRDRVSGRFASDESFSLDVAPRSGMGSSSNNMLPRNPARSRHEEGARRLPLVTLAYKGTVGFIALRQAMFDF